MNERAALQAELMDSLLERNLTCATAESCTGGLAAAFITEIPGISQVFLGGVVTYCNEMKAGLLGVSPQTLHQFSAISSQTAAEMAMGLRERTGADIAVSVTGNAGPAASEGKPVGLVFLGVESPWHSQVTELHLVGSREEIRHAAAIRALQEIVNTAKLNSI